MSGTLVYLKKGGRIGGASALIGLHIGSGAIGIVYYTEKERT
ncbi:hypothetical protein [Tissierella praeacuta]|nr:hypothetical protein [Tissierella praeacuta]